MSHTHGGAEGHESHGGSRGPGWELLDSIMLACAVVLGFMAGELLWQAYKERRDGVRYDLTPEGAKATEAPSVPLVDLDKLAEAVSRGDLGTEAPAPAKPVKKAAVPRPPRNSPGVSAG